MDVQFVIVVVMVGRQTYPCFSGTRCIKRTLSNLRIGPIPMKNVYTDLRYLILLEITRATFLLLP